MVLETFSVSHGKASAYLPVLELLHDYFEIADDDDAAHAAREGRPARSSRSIVALEDTLPYLFALLGIVEGDDPLAQMDAQIKKRRTLEAIKRILLRESPQSAADGDLRGPALDRRADPGVAEPAGRLDRHREDSAAGELSARILASVEQQDLLHAACGSIRWARRAPRRC